MTDENQAEIESVEAPLEEVVAADDMQKPMYNKIQMADVVKREKQKAFERGKREALMELQQQANPNQSEPMQAAPAAPQMLGGMKQLSPEDIERMIAEKAPLAVQGHVQKLQQDYMVNTFVSKMQLAEQKYPGIEEELNHLNYNDPRMHSFIEMVNGLDNTGDIMKEVLDHPSKLTELLADINSQPYLAQKKLQSLSASIKQNERAKAEEKEARDPMSQLKPSMGAGLDNGNMSVSDIRKAMLSGSY